MTIKAQLADGRVLEFPDGTDPKVIQATVKRIIGGDVAQPQQAGVDPDVPTAQNLNLDQQRAQQARAQQVDPSFADKVIGTGDAALSLGSAGTTGALGFLGGAVEGLAEDVIGGFGDANAATRGQQRAEQLTRAPKTEVGRDIVNFVGETLGTLPPYMGMAPFQALRANATARNNNSKEALAIARDAIDNPKETTTVDVVNAIKKGSEKDMQDIVRADPNFYRAADELGLSTEPLASFASENPQFRDVSGALQSVPGSVLDAQARNFIDEVSIKADNLIQEYGGTLDKAQLGSDFKRESLKTVDELFTQADETYSKLREVLPPTTRINPNSTLEFLSMKAMEFGGFDNLPKELKSVFSKLKKNENNEPPTLGLVDQVRKEFGQAIGKGSGRFKDTETGLNKAIYAKLSRDLDEFAESQGGDALAVSNAGKAIVKQRKQLEDNLQVLLGKDLNNALNVTVSGAIKNLSKGQVDRFKEVINAIPKARRGEIVMSAMNDVFKGTGVNQQSLSPTQFTKWYQTINRSPETKRALFSALPKDSVKAIDNLFEVSRGISRAQGQKVSTGRINALFNNDTGFIRKLVGKVTPAIVGFSTGSPAASMATNATMDFLKQSTDGAKKASEMIGTPAFQDMIKRAVRDGFIEGSELTDNLMKAQSRLERTSQYKKWADSLADNGVVIPSGGVLSYLFIEDKEQEEK